MTDVQINHPLSSSPKLRIFSAVLGRFAHYFRARPMLDVQSMPDYLRRDIGLAPAEIAVEQDIKMLNVNIRSGIIFPRPC